VTVANARALHAAARAAALADAGLGAAGEAISFGPEGTQFTKPVTITLPYDANLVPPGLAGTPRDQLFRPRRQDLDAPRHDRRHDAPPAQRQDLAFLAVPAARDSHRPRVGPSGRVRPAARSMFSPNPARGTRLATFRIQPGLADSVEVHVYDVTGRKVHSSSDFKFSVADDGKRPRRAGHVRSRLGSVGRGLGRLHLRDHRQEVRPEGYSCDRENRGGQMRKIFLLAASLALVAPVHSAETAAFLNLGVGARYLAMGGAGNGAVGRRQRFILERGRTRGARRELASATWSSNRARGSTFAAYAQPTSSGRSRLGGAYLSQSAIDGRDPNGRATGSFSAADSDIALGYGRKTTSSTSAVP